MSDNISVLAFDVGIHTGWAYKDDYEEISGNFTLPKKNRLTFFKNQTSQQIDLWKPQAIVYGKPNIFGKNYFNVLVFHSKLAGIVELIAEQKEATCYVLNDTTARKTVFGKDVGKKAANKQINLESPDEADALILARSQYKILKNPTSST